MIKLERIRLFKDRFFNFFEKISRLIISDIDPEKVNINTSYLSQSVIRIIEGFVFSITILVMIMIGGYFGSFIPIFFVSLFILFFGINIVIIQSFIFMEIKIKNLKLKQAVVNLQFDLDEKERIANFRKEREALRKKYSDDKDDDEDDEDDEDGDEEVEDIDINK